MPMISVRQNENNRWKAKVWYHGFLMKWSNSEISLRQWNMPIINVRHNGNNGWKKKKNYPTNM